ncbi:hypothetical protein [Dickeya oryzae]|uniref:hypothetical protein n=1 Tax=Dickeya oryzae TaxID=1240404 RepID=UPI00187CB8FB|nr:hypothetical protein [Dickeya oryzae]
MLRIAAIIVFWALEVIYLDHCRQGVAYIMRVFVKKNADQDLIGILEERSVLRQRR